MRSELPNMSGDGAEAATRRYPVNEVFATVQGEGAYTGTPSVFIRLQACDVGCPWCDTKHTWELERMDHVERRAVLLKDERATRAWAWFHVEHLLEALAAWPAVRHVVITGGEPCRYDLRPLTSALLATGRTVQIETSGTEPIQVDDGAWVTVSPKLDMPGGKEVLPDALARANEVKHPVGRPLDVQRLVERVAPHAARNAVFWLQPLSQSPSATRLCVTESLARGFRVSIQTHKYLGVR